MEMTIANPQKGRLETIKVEITKENTTWFDCARKADDVYTITDIEAGLLIAECRHSYPVLVYDQSRASINYSRTKAKKLRKTAMEG